jgi:hypothetical protein
MTSINTGTTYTAGTYVDIVFYMLDRYGNTIQFNN